MSQLDLFEGVLLSTKQEKEVATWIENQAKRVVNVENEIHTVSLMLDRAGFVQNTDYDVDFNVYEVTSEKEFGYSYNNTNFTKEVTYMEIKGGIYLKVNDIKDGKIVNRSASINREGDKLMCTSITEQYRYYKPTSLLVKLKDHNLSQINKLERLNAEDIAIKNVIAKFQKQYPKAKVTRSTDVYRRSYEQFPIIEVKFASGSRVSFTLGWSNDLENVRFHKKYDAVRESTEELMERFNNQNKN